MHSKQSSFTLSIVILSGLSGAGKSVALRSLEDIGYYCIDNLPALLIKPLIETLKIRENLNALAVGIDIREKDFLAEASELLKRLRDDVKMEVVFLEAAEETLVRRYRETRRPHPMLSMNSSKTIQEAIGAEKELLAAIRAEADRIIDTSNYNPHELRAFIQSIYSPSDNKGGLRLLLMSFGFKYGIPQQADMLLDARFLPNPHFNHELRPLRGTDLAVYEFVMNSRETQRFLHHVMDLLNFVLPCYEKERRSYFTLAIGCTGGRHRSPALVLKIAEELKGRFSLDLQVVHRDLENE